jgi:hypothetical protein
MNKIQNTVMNGGTATSHPGKTALIVIGMHRSGTSATTGALQCLGVQLGKKLYAGHVGINAKGYFEHSGIADTNEEALLALGSGWDDVLLKEDGWWNEDCLNLYGKRVRQYIQRDFSNSQLWAVKDPRVCRLLPWWLDMLSAEQVSPYFLFVVRSPADVFRSLQRRDGFSKEKAYLLWTLHYLEAERGSRNRPRAFMDFDRFLVQPQVEFERVERELGLSFPKSPSQAGNCLEQFISRDLRHHQSADNQDPGTPILDLARDLHKHLLNAVEKGDAALDVGSMDALWQRMVDIQNSFPNSLVDHLRGINRSRGKSELTLNRLVRSWSWFTGKPVRVVERWLGRDV